MEIISPPKTCVECPYCECTFTYKKEDIDTYKITQPGFFTDTIYYEKRVECPGCFKEMRIQRYI